MWVLCEEFDVTLEVTPWKIKGRMKLLNLECSINYDAKHPPSGWKGKTHTF